MSSLRWYSKQMPCFSAHSVSFVLMYSGPVTAKASVTLRERQQPAKSGQSTDQVETAHKRT